LINRRGFEYYIYVAKSLKDVGIYIDKGISIKSVISIQILSLLLVVNFAIAPLLFRANIDFSDKEYSRMPGGLV